MQWILPLLFVTSIVMAAEPHESAELAAQREKMQHRQRRLIYNNDSGDIYAAAANTVDGFYAQRMNATIDSKIDTVFYCTGATVMFNHLAKVGETYGQYCGDMPIGRNIETLKKAGHDVLDMVIEFGRKHDKEIFFTHRINDIHDSMDDCAFELSTWKRENPEYWICKKGLTKDLNDPKYWWSSLDFEKQPVRDYLLAIVDDVCSRYDLDGYDVDYFRSPMFFKPNLEYKPATQAQLDLLTEFQRKIRKTAYKYGNKRGRPMLVSVRVPMSVEACRHVGIDIERWLKEDLFDILCTGGGYVPFTMTTRQMVELGHQYGKPVYPGVSASGMRGREGKYSSLNSWRGVVSNALNNGADGILLFNTFPKDKGHPHFNELGDHAALTKLNKLFAIDNQAILEGDLRQGIVQSHILPVELDSKGKPRIVILPVGDDVSSAKELLFDVKLSNAAAVEIKINGRLIDKASKTKDGRLRYQLSPKQLKQGDNAVAFRVTKPAGQTAQVLAVELYVNY